MLQKKPGHDPVKHTITILQTLLQCLKDGYFATKEHNPYIGLLLEDARILFREYHSMPIENKWDGFIAERIEVMGFIHRAQELVFHTVAEKDVTLIIEGMINCITHNTWDEKLPEREQIVHFLSFTLDDLISFQFIRGKHQHTA